MASGYRTTPTLAIHVIRASVPVDLLIDVRKDLDDRGGGHQKQARKEARERTIEKWQNTWDNNTYKAQWTKRIIPDIEEWLKCIHRVINYHLAEYFSGQGYFQKYPRTIGKQKQKTVHSANN